MEFRVPGQHFVEQVAVMLREFLGGAEVLVASRSSEGVRIPSHLQVRSAGGGPGRQSGAAAEGATPLGSPLHERGKPILPPMHVDPSGIRSPGTRSLWTVTSCGAREVVREVQGAAVDVEPLEEEGHGSQERAAKRRYTRRDRTILKRAPDEISGAAPRRARGGPKQTAAALASDCCSALCGGCSRLKKAAERAASLQSGQRDAN